MSRVFALWFPSVFMLLLVVAYCLGMRTQSRKKASDFSRSLEEYRRALDHFADREHDQLSRLLVDASYRALRAEEREANLIAHNASRDAVVNAARILRSRMACMTADAVITSGGTWEALSDALTWEALSDALDILDGTAEDEETDDAPR